MPGKTGTPPKQSGEAGRRAVLEAMQAAVAAHKQGRLEAAIAGYRQVLHLAPDFPEAHNNLGVALKAAGSLREAVASYREALQLRPKYPSALANMAAARAALGEHDRALKLAIEAVNLEPGNVSHCQVLAGQLRNRRFSEASDAVVRAVRACFEAPGVEHQLITPAALSLLKVIPAVRTAWACVDHGGRRDLAVMLDDGDLDELFEVELLQLLLTRTLLPDEALEQLFTAFRHCCLEAVAAEALPPPGIYHPDPALIAALAELCFHNDYAFAESAPEADLVAGLSEAAPGLAPNLDTDSPKLVVLAMYRPLFALADCGHLAEPPPGLPPAIARLLRRQVSEPLAERAIAPIIPRLTPIEAGVSRAVQRQYEESPYPRWRASGVKQPRPLGDVVASLFPHLETPPQAPSPTRILIAGCGTGKHALDVASRYRDAQVLAIDLSTTALAFARRKLDEAGLANVEIAQADILALGERDTRFDLIEAVGVLHHLADPPAGWRVLTGLLAAGGFMKLGFYSRAARRDIAAARNLLRNAGFAATPEGIRAARGRIFALAPDDPARQVTGELDFYSLSGCRDLLFNVQERDYRLPELAAALADLELEFLGFEFPEEAPRRAYAERFPQDPTMTDLALWDSFEAENPETFRNMYQFWCRRAD